MNEYLKEIATLCGIDSQLNTHKARRTFGSTVTLNNGVPIHVVKEMMGHQSVRQTEEYALTEQETISKEMKQLKDKLTPTKEADENDPMAILHRLEQEIGVLKQDYSQKSNRIAVNPLEKVAMELQKVKNMLQLAH